jgi:hypothetical protein
MAEPEKRPEESTAPGISVPQGSLLNDVISWLQQSIRFLLQNIRWYLTMGVLVILTFHMLYILLLVWKEGVLIPSPFIYQIEKPYTLATDGKVNEILVGAIIAFIMGGIGSVIFCFKSLFNGALTDYLVLLFRPLYGSLLALIFYFLLRSGLFAFSGGKVEIPAAGTPELDIARATVAGISGLVGMFAEQAMNKLRELFDSLFTVKKP